MHGRLDGAWERVERAKINAEKDMQMKEEPLYDEDDVDCGDIPFTEILRTMQIGKEIVPPVNVQEEAQKLDPEAYEPVPGVVKFTADEEEKSAEELERELMC
jgi:hypothetical protein